MQRQKRDFPHRRAYTTAFPPDVIKITQPQIAGGFALVQLGPMPVSFLFKVAYFESNKNVYIIPEFISWVCSEMISSPYMLILAVLPGLPTQITILLFDYLRPLLCLYPH